MPGGSAIPSAPRIDWEQAFAYFVALGPRRSFAKVSREFSVSGTAVRKHALKERWIRRAKRIDAASQARVERGMVRARSERLADQIQVIDAYRVGFASALMKGEVPMHGHDLAALAKLEALLEGEATERVDRADLDREVRRWIDVASEFVPEDRWDAFLNALEADVDE
ncbi:MAG: hypothetical protein WBB76_04845 [Gaiellaceae bacterium]